MQGASRARLALIHLCAFAVFLSLSFFTFLFFYPGRMSLWVYDWLLFIFVHLQCFFHYHFLPFFFFFPGRMSLWVYIVEGS
ncbi:hypothetical protein BDB00DRAFT_47468 [Zychaea mexicana]|uniref:uncharacterized protein n=1 Tax=Zychaea mexicana TaxID=64656 RepID=UPI0022FEEEFF|nr:uncharacterized protein BDB00DRAFT_47468 [Zychaea mexicana]KAI9496960.1 hypothetical protein BDB00DRAFT_47468 [Zychaea mexicana]